jgi:glyoxylase-like metal-dependent hydrolase (beta-lactamase superfamily II)
MSSVVLGDFEILHIQPAAYRWDGGAFFGVVPKTMWGRKAPSDELNRIRVAFNCYMIRTGKHNILVETGGGDKLDARARERMALGSDAELVQETLARQGFAADSIDIVINSHLHWDHCGGNTTLTDAGVVATFPRAQYYALRPEWEHAHERHVRDSVSYNDANYDPLVESGQMTLLEGDAEVVPGVRMRRAPGHNRDMCVVTAASGGQTFCFFSDLVPTAAHVQPTWVMAFDLFPMQTIDNKFDWLDAASRENWVCGFAHDPDMPFARIVADPKTRFAAAEHR